MHVYDDNDDDDDEHADNDKTSLHNWQIQMAVYIHFLVMNKMVFRT
jgi:hypothetical protein